MKNDRELVNHPDHYSGGAGLNTSIEVIEMMRRIWGKDVLISFCEMNAFKYRMRAGKKDKATALEDLDKARWYEDYANKLVNNKHY